MSMRAPEPSDDLDASRAAGRPKIVMYATSTCGYCWRAARLLTAKGCIFETIDVTFDRPRRAWLVQQTGRRTVPQIRIGDRWVGGFEEIRELDAKGEFDRILSGAA
jgi:glutaredoxin 3